MGHYFGILPEEVIVVEAEPLDTDYGDGLSEPMARLVPFVAQEVLTLACRPSPPDLPPFRFSVSATAGGFTQRPTL